MLEIILGIFWQTVIGHRRKHMRCPKCSGKRLNFSKTTEIKIGKPASLGEEVPLTIECMNPNCKYKSDNKSEWKDDK
jgi:hypothetical protein